MSLGKIGLFGKEYVPNNTIKFAPLFVKCVRFGEDHGLTFDEDYSGVCVNKNFQCKSHTDKYNKGCNHIIAFGDFEGGKLKVGDEIIDIKHRLTRFDPKIPHEVLPFSGTRYTLTFFTRCFHKK